MERVEDIFSKPNGAMYFSTLMLGTITYLLMKALSPKQLLYLLLENMIIIKFLLDWHKHQYISKN